MARGETDRRQLKASTDAARGSDACPGQVAVLEETTHLTQSRRELQNPPSFRPPAWRLGRLGGQLQEAIQQGSAFLTEGVHPTWEIEAVLSNSNNLS